MSKCSTFPNTFIRIATTSLAVMTLNLMAVSPAAARVKPKAKTAKAGLDIMLMQPKTVKADDNQFEVMVKGDGKAEERAAGGGAPAAVNK